MRSLGKLSAKGTNWRHQMCFRMLKIDEYQRDLKRFTFVLLDDVHPFRLLEFGWPMKSCHQGVFMLLVGTKHWPLYT